MNIAKVGESLYPRNRTFQAIREKLSGKSLEMVSKCGQNNKITVKFLAFANW